MTIEDAITIVGLVVDVMLAALVAVLISRGKLQPELWPPLLGIGGGLFSFLVLMALSIGAAQNTHLLDGAHESLPWSVALGAIAYPSGHILTRGARRRK